MPRTPAIPNRALPYFRRIQGCSLDELSARLNGALSKVFLSKVERGERNPSEDSKQLITDALKSFPTDEQWSDEHPLAQLLLPGLTVDEVFPPDWKKTPDQAFATYLLAARQHSQLLSGSVPESEFERDMRRLGLDPEEEARTPSPLVDTYVDENGSQTLVVDFSQLDESVRPMRLEIRPPVKPLRPRARQSRAQRSGKRAAGKSPPSSDPDEPEPELGPSTSKDFAVPTAARKIEHAGTVPSQQAVSGAARLQRAVR